MVPGREVPACSSLVTCQSSLSRRWHDHVSSIDQPCLCIVHIVTRSQHLSIQGTNMSKGNTRLKLYTQPNKQPHAGCKGVHSAQTLQALWCRGQTRLVCTALRHACPGPTSSRTSTNKDRLAQQKAQPSSESKCNTTAKFEHPHACMHNACIMHAASAPQDCMNISMSPRHTHKFCTHGTNALHIRITAPCNAPHTKVGCTSPTSRPLTV